MDADLLRALLPAITGVIGALAGAVVGGTVQWLGNRSNARLQADAQRQLAALQIEAQRRLAADDRRYKRRQEEVSPKVELVRRQAGSVRDFVTALESRDMAAAKAISSRMREEIGSYDITRIVTTKALEAEYRAFQVARGDAFEQMTEIMTAAEATIFPPRPDDTKEEMWARFTRDLHVTTAPVMAAAIQFERAIDAYLDDLPDSALTKHL